LFRQQVRQAVDAAGAESVLAQTALSLRPRHVQALGPLELLANP
jgi:hypothetical protein